MKIINVLTIVVFIAGVSASSTFAAKENPCDNVTIEWMQSHVPIPPAKIISKTPESGLCQVVLQIGQEFVPTYTGKNFVLAGEMFRGRVQVTESKILGLKKEMMSKNMDELETVVAMAYTPETSVGKSVYFLTDPLCPYCSRAGKQLKALADRTGVTFKVVFANVHGQKGEDKIKEAICGEYDFVKYNSDDWKRTTPQNIQCAAADDLWPRSQGVVGKIGLKGVPAFITEDGDFVSGANIPALEKAIVEMIGKAMHAKAESP